MFTAYPCLPNNLYQIKTKEYKYPYKVYKVPVQSRFFDHQVMSSLMENILLSHDQHYDIDDNA